MGLPLNFAGQNTVAPGTGTFTLSGTVAGHQTLAAAGAVNGSIVSYVAEYGTDREVGVGVYSSTGPTLTRNLRGSTTGSLLNITGTAQVYCDVLASDIQDLPRGMLRGLGASNSGGSSATMALAAGMAADASSPWEIIRIGAFTKTTSAWAAGTGNGALDTGTIAASTWYHWHLIGKLDGTADWLCSLSATAPTMPSGYSLKRRVFSMKTNGSSQWPLFKQVGNTFLWDTKVKDLDTSAAGAAASVTLSVPPIQGILALLELTGFNGASVVNFAVWSPDVADVTPGATTGISLKSIAAGTSGGSTKLVPVNASGQVRYAADVASSTLRILAEGWIDHQGRLD